MDVRTGWAFINMGSLLINMFFGIYCLYGPLEKSEALLHDVKFVARLKIFFGESLLGRQARLTAIARVVTMPKRMQRRGEISREAYLRLPASLKLQIRALYLLAFANCVGMACFYFLVD
jgi:hypothetical protein